MLILQDSREQQPYRFERYQAEVEEVTLPCGDYSLSGFEDRVAIERKNLNDLIGCLMNSNRERFERELQRAKHYDLFLVMVEASLNDVLQGHYRSDMKPHAAAQSIITFSVRYRVPFLWAGSREQGEYLTYWHLQKHLYEIHQRYNQAVKAQAEKAA